MHGGCLTLIRPRRVVDQCVWTRRGPRLDCSERQTRWSRGLGHLLRWHCWIFERFVSDLVERLVPDTLCVLTGGANPRRRLPSSGGREAGDSETLAMIVSVVTSGCIRRQVPSLIGPARSTIYPAMPNGAGAASPRGSVTPDQGAITNRPNGVVGMV